MKEDWIEWEKSTADNDPVLSRGMPIAVCQLARAKVLLSTSDCKDVAKQISPRR